MLRPKSIIDDDLYKWTMANAIFALYGDGPEVEYTFINRRLSNKFNKEAFEHIKNEITGLSDLALTDAEAEFLKNKTPLSDEFIAWVKDFRFDPSDSEISMENGELSIQVRGTWLSKILWEVRVLYIVSEAYYKFVDTDWTHEGQEELLIQKCERLEANNVLTMEFGTRRRRDFESQDRAVRVMKNYNFFQGTSNIYLAMKYDVPCKGTQAHEWFMAHAVLCSLRHCNRYALEQWMKVYDEDLAIALTDTYGSKAFFKDFHGKASEVFKGLRHDSGDPITFTDDTIAALVSLNFDPLDRLIVFSDGLDVDEAIRLKIYCEGKIKSAAGMGTHLTNDFEGSEALQIVMKLTRVDGVPVVKLSDEPGKVSGDRDAVRIAKHIFFGTPL